MSKKAFKLRPFGTDDAKAVTLVLLDTFASTWEPELTPDARAAIEPPKMMADYVKESGAEFVVAEYDSKIAGMVHWRDDFVYALHVQADAQGQGIGDALINHAETAIRLDGLMQVRLETDTFNKTARRFYENRGYVEVRREPDKDWNSGFITVCFEKRFEAF